MQSKNFLPLSFAGTCLASSYLPVFLKHVDKKYTSEKIETYTTSLGYSITPQYAVLPIFPAFNEVLMQICMSLSGKNYGNCSQVDCLHLLREKN